MKPVKIYLSLSLLILLSAFLWFSSCSHVANIANLPEVCFDGQVLPIFRNNCAISHCHDGVGGDSRMALATFGDISRSIVPFDPAGSQAYQAIIAKWGNRMPPGQPLTETNRILIRLWIEQGATQTTCVGTSGTGNDSSNVATVASSGLLLNSLKGNGVVKMPVGGSFSLCRIRQFEIWINNGFVNN